MIVRFDGDSDLCNFGFDLRSDRVISFVKRPGGVLLKTRATYTINEKMYSHLFLRTKAIELKTRNSDALSKVKIVKDKLPRRLIILFVICFILTLLVNCSGKFNLEINSPHEVSEAVE